MFNKFLIIALITIAFRKLIGWKAIVIHIFGTFTLISRECKKTCSTLYNRIVCSKSNFSRNTILFTVNSRPQYADTITTSRFLTTQRAAITDYNFITRIARAPALFIDAKLKYARRILARHFQSRDPRPVLKFHPRRERTITRRKVKK